ncbi:MAG: NAD(P)H-dependent oxidoreductase [Thermoplasmata archaeon]|nr:NAD(P)H-dependent oxidoreductase [Thermoplasmata archaeon]
MVKMLVSYYSRSGHTKRMAEEIAKAAEEAGAEVDLLILEKVDVKSLVDYDCLVIGSPTYYGQMAGVVKEFFDRSVKIHGKLAGKIGGAFSSSGLRAGGNETTVLSILQAWLVHGMLVMGTSGADHFGPVSVGEPDEAALKSCAKYAKRLVEHSSRLSE